VALARVVVCALGTASLVGGAAGGTARTAVAPPQRYYLALGDSLAFRIQADKVNAGLPPSGFDTGYVDVFAARLRALAPRLRVVNYGCPGESTQTFIGGGCPWLVGHKPLHDSFRGPQLAAALAFLRTHRGQVSPITLDGLWGKDADALSKSCNGSIACARARAPRAIAQFASRLTSILRQLRAAAPNAQIIVTGAWNNDIVHTRQTDPLVHSLDLTIARVAAAARARFADVFPAFNPQGNLAREKTRICTLTLTCSEGDGHPTNAGYRAIAAAVWAASGYR
jgi:lysophospholipase L1-like esterase